MDRFTVEIFPVVVRFAALCFKCPDQQSMALTFAWHSWFTAEPDKQGLPASVWARLGVMRVRAERDLPGIRSKFRDALHKAQRCGTMEGLPDRYPGPEQIAMDRERYTVVFNSATDRERALIECFEAGMKGIDVAAMFGISPGRVSQIRREMMERDR